MAITATACLEGSGRRTGVSLMMSRRGQAVRGSRSGWHRFSITSANRSRRLKAQAAWTSGLASPQGVIGAAVVQTARRSAHLTRLRLARLLNVSTATVRARENGAIPLFCVPYAQLQHLADTLDHAGAQGTW
jgi:DNA-binding transcriptional regulator YiaG